MEAPPPAAAAIACRDERRGVGGLLVEDWSTFKARGRDLLSRARNPQKLLRRMQSRAAMLLKSDLDVAKLKREMTGGTDAGQGAAIQPAELRVQASNPVSNEEDLGAVSDGFGLIFKRGSGMRPDEAKGINRGVNPVKLEAKFEELQAYFLRGGSALFSSVYSVLLHTSFFCCSVLSVHGRPRRGSRSRNDEPDHCWVG